MARDVVRLVQRERVCRVATIDLQGQPHVVPVCHVWDGRKLYFAADASSRKVQHLKANPRVAVVVDVYVEDWSRLVGVLLQGKARLLTGGPRFRHARTLLYKKYPHYPEEAPIEAPSTVIVEVTPTRAASWGVDEFAGRCSSL